MGKNVVMGYAFEEKTDATQAKKELELISNITKQDNLNNPKIALNVYNQLIEEKTFKTPVGIEFLRSLQKELLNIKSIDRDQICAIPVSVAQEEEPLVGTHARRQMVVDSLKKSIEDYKEKYTRSMIVNFVLVAVIVGMFIILEVSQRFDEQAFRNSVENEYISWEAQLQERESAIQSKEAELGIEPSWDDDETE